MPGRDGFLDAIRAVAVIRVVTWHTYGWAPITWVVAAVPAMFFVSGHLLARSFERRSPRVVVADRLRRLLIPYWLFGLVAWSVMAAARQLEHTPETALPWGSLIWWVLPFNDPHGSVWEAGWLAQPLWYVRCLLWLLVLSPLLYRAARRAPRLLIAVLVAATLALEIVYRNGTWDDEAVPNALWRAGDISLYAVFLVLGFVHSRSGEVARGRAFTAALLAVPLALGVALVARPQDGIVNNSHILHLVVGGGWLAVALALRAPIARLASTRGASAVVRGIGRRSLSIYLWHTAAVITTWHLVVRLAPLPRGVYSVLLGLGTVAGTLALVAVVGHVEDLAARRAPMALPRRPVLVRATAPVLGIALFALAAGVLLPDTAERDRPFLAAPLTLAGTFAASTSGASSAATTASTSAESPASPRIPSRAPRVRVAEPQAAATVSSTLPGASTSAVAADDPEPGSDAASPSAEADGLQAEADGLQGVLNRWQSSYGSSGLVVGVSRPGSWEWIGSPYDGGAGGSFDIESVTKTVTAAAAWLLVADGVLDVEGPLPAIDGLPELAARGLTLRQLLEHRSGIPDYHNLESPESLDEQPAVTVVRNALAADSVFAPGGGQDYSSTNYLLVGLVIEARTGRPLDDVLWGRVLDPVGVGAMFSRAGSSIYWPGGGAGGLITDMSGMLAWGSALLRDHQPVGEATWTRMSQLDPNTALGAGAMGLCPCQGGFFWVGHTGGTTALFYDRSDNVLIALRIANGIWGAFEDPFVELVESLRITALSL